MKIHPRRVPARWSVHWAVLLLALASTATAVTFRSEAERRFSEENEEIMIQMMAGMNVPLSGDVDRDFLRMMIPHHQGAIDMARAVLRHGKDEKVRRLAQGIVVEQQQEISVMRMLLDAGCAATDRPGADRPGAADLSASCRDEPSARQPHHH